MKRKLIVCMALFLFSGVTTVSVNAQDAKIRVRNWCARSGSTSTASGTI